MTAFLAAWLAVMAPADLHGRVIDAQTGLPVAHVAILIDGVRVAETDDRGEFTTPVPARPRVELMVTAVGYGFVKRAIDVTAGPADLGTIALNRESASVSELVTVTGAFARDADATVRRLNRSELQALSMVLVDDPLR